MKEAEKVLQEGFAFAHGISEDNERSMALSFLCLELAKQGKFEEALACTRGIKNETYSYYIKCSTLSGISTEMAKHRQTEVAEKTLQEALTIAGEIDPMSSLRSETLRAISSELVKQGKLEAALSIARAIFRCGEIKIPLLLTISAESVKTGKFVLAETVLQEALTYALERTIDGSDKNTALLSVATEMAKQGKIEEALECTRSMSDDLKKNRWLDLQRQSEVGKSQALLAIATELSKQGKWQMAEATAKEKLQQATRQEFWLQIGKDAYADKGYQEALQVLPHFTSAEAQEHILQGITQGLQVDAITKEVAHLALKLPAQKVQSMEHVMQVYAINQLFFEDLPSEKLQRYNRTLNLQWAIEVKAQMKS